jgi:hypothetical protein
MMMKTFFAAILAAPLALALSAPAAAQDSPYTLGDYSEVALIDVTEGADSAFGNFLRATWTKYLDYAKTKGWVSGYKIYDNVYNRPGEPDMYLVTSFASLPDAAEEERREQAYRDFMKQSQAEVEAASADRGKYRTVMGFVLLRELKFTK